MVKPENLTAYGEPDTAALAVAYGYGISRNHAFIDGNKRTALLAPELFYNSTAGGLLLVMRTAG